MSFEHVLNEVKWNPENAFAQMGFITEVEQQNYEQGGQRSVEITCVDEKEQIYKWIVKNQPGSIYYFPYITGGVGIPNNNNGIGHVIVPKNVPDGTIVITGGMTGCALQVNKFDDNNLIFLHDKNAKAIASPDVREAFIRQLNCGAYFNERDLADPQKIMCRVEPVHYMGRNEIHYEYCLDLAHEKYPGKGFDMAYFPFFIKVQGIWKLYMSLAGKVGDAKGIVGYVKGEGVYMPNIHCVTSFEAK